ncbi:MAG: hypothetical protein JWP11_1076 [Frankiales bacterium]|nr:hypothetical protein [Frankiales bacterium]
MRLTGWIGCGAAGSALVAVGGFGVGAVPASLADGWLHASSSGRLLAGVLSGLGVVILLLAWWRVRGAPPRDVLLCAGIWCVPLLVTPPLFSRDVYAYAGQAHLVAVGIDPYTHGPADAAGPLASEVDDVWAHARSPYGPVFLRVASWLVPGQHVIAAVLLLRLLAVVGLALLAWALLRLAAEPSRALWLGVANPLVLLHGVGGAHNDTLMAGLLAAGLAVAASGGLAAGAALVTVAALVKLPAVAALAFLPFLRPGSRVRGFAVVGAVAAVTAVGLTLATRLGWGWLHTLGAGNARRSLLSVSTGVGVLASNAVGSGAVGVAHAGGLLLAAALGLLLLLRVERVGPLRALGLTLLAVVVLGPVVQPWYLLWALAVLAAVAGARLTLGLAAASAVLCLLILPSGRHLIRPPLYGVPALLAVAAGWTAARRVDH